MIGEKAKEIGRGRTLMAESAVKGCGSTGAIAGGVASQGLMGTAPVGGGSRRSWMEVSSQASE